MPALVVATGRAIMIERLKGQGEEPLYLAWGTDNGTVLPLDDSNTALGSEIGDRVKGASSIEQTKTPGDTYRVVGTFTAQRDVEISEVGLFDAPTGGRLFMRGVFPKLSLEAGDSIQFTIDVQLEPSQE